MAHVPAVEGVVTTTVPFLSKAEPYIGVLQAPNDAVTAAAALSEDSVQVPVPEHPEPFHPVNPPDVATAVRVTEEPAPKLAVHAVPQLIPDGELVTVPVPEPALLTVTA